MKQNPVNKEGLLKQVIPVLVQAGKHLTSTSAGRHEQENKPGTANFVTETDYTVQTQVFCELQRLTPHFGLMGEESSHQNCDFSKPTWILDPVDGTTNLMFQYKHSAISLALYDQQQIVLAATYNPYLDEMFTAVQGQGFFMNGQPAFCHSAQCLGQALVGFGTTPYDRNSSSQTFSIVKNMFEKTLDVRRSGSAVLDLAYVACGRLDAFFELNLQPWDYAAGMLFVKEAGGQLTRCDGLPVSITTADSILASNKHLHPDLLQLIQDAAV